jgi:hypothetical protein
MDKTMGGPASAYEYHGADIYSLRKRLDKLEKVVQQLVEALDDTARRDIFMGHDNGE